MTDSRECSALHSASPVCLLKCMTRVSNAGVPADELHVRRAGHGAPHAAGGGAAVRAVHQALRRAELEPRPQRVRSERPVLPAPHGPGVPIPESCLSIRTAVCMLARSPRAVYRPRPMVQACPPPVSGLLEERGSLPVSRAPAWLCNVGVCVPDSKGSASLALLLSCFLRDTRLDTVESFRGFVAVIR